MCGVAGIYSKEGRDRRALILEMTARLHHRGPDQEGIYVNPNQTVFLGHKRLSILDLSDRGQQPMSDESGEIVISYNGEVYNFHELRERLSGKYSFRSDSDTEVLLYAYKEWGIEFLQHLNGMYAILVYDRRSETLYAIRDRLGIKPLYYASIQGSYYFASEVKSILAVSGYTASVNLQAVSSYLSYRYALGKSTFFEGVHSLEPGHYLEVTKSGAKDVCYWEIPIELSLSDHGEQAYLDEMSRLLRAAVQRRMISDVPFGAYLSGGLDSSAIVALMSEHARDPVKTFTIGFREEGFNEFAYADQVASMHGTDHREILLTAEEYHEAMKTLIRYKDAPLGVPNEVPLYLMSKELKKYITVVLSGEGADEIFSGYGRLFRSPFDYQRMKWLETLGLAKYLPGFRGLYQNLMDRYGRISFGSELDHFLHQYTYFAKEEKFSLFSDGMIEAADDDAWIAQTFQSTFEKTPLSYDRSIAYTFEKLHLPGLLQRVDTCTMATSVEARVPFVDHELVSFMLNVPSKYKMKWRSTGAFLSALTLNSAQISENKDTTKYLLRKSMSKLLPPDVLERKKQGFPVPLDKWFRSDFVELAKSELLAPDSQVQRVFAQDKLRQWMESGSSAGFGQKLWMILNLEYFFREYV